VRKERRLTEESELASARRGVAAAFLADGVLVGTFASRLPAIQEHLGLSAATLGVALVGAPVGLVVAMQCVAWFVSRTSNALTLRVSMVAASAALVLPAVAANVYFLTLAISLLGFARGASNVSMFTQGVGVERAMRRPAMAGMHAMFGVGMLAGAGLGALAAAGGIAVTLHYALTGLTVALAGWVATGALLTDHRLASTDESGKRDCAVRSRHARRVRDHRTLILLGFVAFCGFLVEDVVGDWGGVFLRDVHGASLSVAPLAASAFAAGTAVGRLAGDALIARHGRAGMLWRAPTVGVIGMLIAVTADRTPLVIAGFGIVGLGIATIVPITFVLAGGIDGVSSTWAIARTSTIASLSLFVGPPAVGLVGDGYGLRVAFLIPTLLLACIVPAAARAQRAPARRDVRVDRPG
jgi:MFS family permease